MDVDPAGPWSAIGRSRLFLVDVQRRAGNRVATELVSGDGPVNVSRDIDVEGAQRLLRAAGRVLSGESDAPSALAEARAEARVHRLALWDLAKAVAGREPGEADAMSPQRVLFWLVAGSRRLSDAIDLARREPSLQAVGHEVQQLIASVRDRTSDPSGAGVVVRGGFRVYGPRRDDIADHVPRVAAGIDALPPEHRGMVGPLFVVPRLPGGKSTGGGYFRSAASWFGKSTRTGVPDADLHALVDGPSVPIVAITYDAAEGDAPQFTAAHEVGHVVNDIVSIEKPGATLADYYGMVYPEVNLREYAAEAYARYFLARHRMFRVGRVALRPGETLAQANARLRSVVEASPALGGG